MIIRRATIPSKQCPTRRTELLSQNLKMFAPLPLFLLILCGTQLRRILPRAVCIVPRAVCPSFRSSDPRFILFAIFVPSFVAAPLDDHSARLLVIFYAAVWRCRPGVTNNELHRIIRRHVSRFVPSLSASAPMPSSATKGAPPRSSPGKEGAGAGAMAVEGQATQEAGISSTRHVLCRFFVVVGCGSSKLAIVLSCPLYYSSHVFAYKLQYF